MFDLVPVDHDPFADPPFKLIPVDHDPFAVGPAAQPADPAMAAAAAPQLVPVDHDPFAAAPADALPRIIVHPKPPNAPPDNPADADGPDDWFVPMADGYPDDWFVPAPLATPGPGQSGPSAQSNTAIPPLSNPPAVRPEPSAAYWSLIPASRAGAFAWHPPIFPNSAGQFPPSAPAYDPPVLPAGGLLGVIGRKLAASANGPGIGYGLFGSPSDCERQTPTRAHRSSALAAIPRHLRSTRRISAGARCLPTWPTRRRHQINRPSHRSGNFRTRPPQALSRSAPGTALQPFRFKFRQRPRPRRAPSCSINHLPLGTRARPIGTPQTSIKPPRPWAFPICRHRNPARRSSPRHRSSRSRLSNGSTSPTC